MIHLNLRPDLEAALRKISGDSGYAITTVCAALMHLGLTTGAERIDQACAQHARPMGRPVTDVPVLGSLAKPEEPKKVVEKDHRPGWFMVRGKRKFIEPWEPIPKGAKVLPK